MGKTKVLINDVDCSELITELSTSIEFEKDYLIGNAPSKVLTLKANNENGEFNDLLDSPFVLQREDGTKLGTFYVMEKPERMTGELNLELYDSMCLSNINYVSNLEYPTTIKGILDDMATILGIEIDYLSLPSYALDRIVNAYDNTEMIRTHLCWIAELGVSNVFSDKNGNYVFIPISKEVIHDLPPDDVEQFETIEDLIISGVQYDNGVANWLSGNEDNNVYKIDENNLYIDSQEDLNNIYTLLCGLSFRSSKGLKCACVENLQLGQIINIADDFKTIPLSIKTTYLNATYDIQEISGEISTKNKSTITKVSSTSTKIRRIQTIVDQNNAALKILAQDVENNESRISKLELSSEQFEVSITEKVEKIESEVTVTSISSQYGISTDKTTEPTSWEDTRPTLSYGQWLWMREVYTYSDGTIKYDGVRMISAEDGQDAVLLQILSSNGHIFKNNLTSTTLTVEILVAGLRITSSRDMYSYFGENAKIVWQQKKQGETEYSDIDSSDPRLSDNAFIFTINTEDLKYETVYSCYLDC